MEKKRAKLCIVSPSIKVWHEQHLRPSLNQIVREIILKNSPLYFCIEESLH